MGSGRPMGIGNGFKDLSGRVFGKLIVLSLIGKIKGKYYWLCRCECGIEKKIRGHHLSHGKIVTCGCSKYVRTCEITKPVQDKLGTFASVYRYYWHSAKRRGLVLELSTNTFIELIQSPCSYCGKAPSNVIRDRQTGTNYYTGIDRVDNSKGYIEGNVVPACKICNLIKHTMTSAEFLEHVQRIYNYTCKRNVA